MVLYSQTVNSKDMVPYLYYLPFGNTVPQYVVVNRQRYRSVSTSTGSLREHTCQL